MSRKAAIYNRRRIVEMIPTLQMSSFWKIGAEKTIQYVLITTFIPKSCKLFEGTGIDFVSFK
jgi:hypothetical protein